MAPAWTDECPVCAAPAARPFLRLLDVPVHPTVLWPSHDAAVAAPRGDLEIVFCESCGLMWNAAFDADLLEYGVNYENSLHFSPAFQAYADELADRLVDRYGIRGKTIVEVGSGKGEFLTLVCAKGGNRGVGFDPSYDGESDASANGSVRFVRELYGQNTHAEAPDLTVCRHVLEHIDTPREFLRSLRRMTVDERAVVYLEVPAGEYALEQQAVWDMIYPHVTLYTKTSLRRLFADAGFRVRESGFSFGGQYLWVEASPAPERRRNAAAPPAAIGSLVSSLRRALEEKQAMWRERLARLEPTESVAVWGAGAKGATFLNLVDREGRIEHVIDVNPRKHGNFVPGTGQRISSPQQLAAAAPSLVLVMNPIYVDEIRGQLAQLGLSPVVEAV